MDRLSKDEVRTLQDAVADGLFDEEEWIEYDGESHWSEYYEADPLTQARKLGGYRGIAYAIIVQATIDLESTDDGIKRDALDYFKSDAYRDLLDLLGLPMGWLPDGVVLD